MKNGSRLIYNVIKDPQWYAVVSEPLVSGQATTLPDCVKQTGMLPWKTNVGSQSIFIFSK